MIKDYNIKFNYSEKDIIEDWEEITVEDFLERENASKEEYYHFLNEIMAINIHQLICKEMLEQTYETLYDYYHNKIKGLNAIVLLSLKQCGRGKSFTPLTQKQFNSLVDTALALNIPIGFDSCSAPKFLEAVKGSTNYKVYEMLAEPCESSLFSVYINVEGKVYPCSFCEESYWKEGIDVLNCNDFVKDVWLSKKLRYYRTNMSCNVNKNGVRTCLPFNL